MAKLRILEERCKGCGLCTTACPRGLLKLDPEHINSRGYTPASIAQPEQCIGCAFCARMCPDCAIEVEK